MSDRDNILIAVDLLGRPRHDRWKVQNANHTTDYLRRLRIIRCCARRNNEIARLETHNKRITGCRVSVIAPSHKHRHGTGFQVHNWLTIPSHENIVVNNSASDDARHEHAEVAIKDAFAAARRQVDSLAA
jgi:Tfp pilus assembly protein PilN